MLKLSEVHIYPAGCHTGINPGVYPQAYITFYLDGCCALYVKNILCVFVSMQTVWFFILCSFLCLKHIKMLLVPWERSGKYIIFRFILSLLRVSSGEGWSICSKKYANVSFFSVCSLFKCRAWIFMHFFFGLKLLTEHFKQKLWDYKLFPNNLFQFSIHYLWIVVNSCPHG